jgi:hypothetical protein
MFFLSAKKPRRFLCGASQTCPIENNPMSSPERSELILFLSLS